MGLKKLIYKVTNMLSGETYIGASSDSLEIRKKDHTLKAKKKVGSKFQNAIASYPPEAFDWKEIDTAYTNNELAEKEKQYIIEYNAKEDGYNADRGGGFQKNIYQYDSETGSLLGMFETLEEAGNSVGVDRKTISKACLGELKNSGGYTWSYELRENFKPERDKRKKKVFQFYIHGEYYKNYDSVAEASSQSGVNKSSIAKCCRGEYNQAGNFYWEYEN